MTNMSNERLEAIFHQSGGKGIAVIGDIMLDSYISGTATRLSQEAPVPVLHVKKKEARLGGAANVMRNLAALSPECRIYAFGVVGDDQTGNLIRKMLKEDGIDVAGILTDPMRKTTEKQRVIAVNQQVIRMDFEDTFPIGDQLSQTIVQSVCSLIKGGQLQAVIFEDYAKGVLQQDMMQQIVDCAGQYHVFTSLDPHPTHQLDVRNLSLMTPNRMEAFVLAGIQKTEPCENVQQDSALKTVAWKLMGKLSPEILLITLSAQGMALFPRSNPDSVHAIPTVAREVFDVCGAGDTVIAAFTLCAVSGASMTEAAEIANHAAGIVVGKSGTATTNLSEIRASFRF